ncbi:hypothetical protein B0J15DRAFT_551482 [Fusarium solani]|uniref:Protein kinase domain-containing protein n=1 Tax=Fusarium solani TaxID=169388 RepID=A0A9P9GYL4_FUSSL|nr:uncharacterized protein B0J15DRAFT_551482 [Fusarium solani]KAH7247810.1 hypothetical protein B0J15DRAFT_551482 [Fusarium solani]
MPSSKDNQMPPRWHKIHDEDESQPKDFLGRKLPKMRTVFPEWLPEKIVLKVEKDHWEEEFETEKTAHDKLVCLQGDVIPRCYGQIEYDGKRALILSDIGGACLATPDGAVLDENDLRLLLDKALTSLTDHQVSHDDTKLDNFHLVTENGKDRIIVIDLEMVDMDLTEDDYAFAAKSSASFLIQQYRLHLHTMEYDEVLLPKRPLKA